MRTILAGAFLCTSLLAAAPASADQLYVGYNDRQTYDLGPRGTDATYVARLLLAARQACGERIGQISLREWQQIRECKRDFIERANDASS